jgi:hypothetical protein
MATDAVLSLNTLFEPVHVRIDGAPHRLMHDDALTLEQTLVLEKLGPRVNELFNKLRDETLNNDERAELDSALDRACRLVLDAPDVVHKRLTQKHRFEVLKAFMGLRSKGAANGEMAAHATAQDREATGPRPSPVSSDSTVEPQMVG